MPNDHPASTRGTSGTAEARAAAAARTSSCSPIPWSWVPVEGPTPRKLKRRAARPRQGSSLNSVSMTPARISPP
jgi:hypothetical protein